MSMLSPEVFINVFYNFGVVTCTILHFGFLGVTHVNVIKVD